MEKGTIDLEQLKKIQFEILCYVDDFCRKHNIRYWIDVGTLLGAVRHQGFIPWDDDIDIGMLRDDYDTFIKIFPGSSDRYILKSMEIDKNYYLPYGKVMDNRTVLYEPDRNGYQLAVNIDVFVYDNAPDDDKKLKRMYDMRDFWRKLNNAQTGHHKKTDNMVKEFVVIAGSKLLKIFPTGYFNRRLVRNGKKYISVETKRVGNFTSETRMSCDKAIFNEFVELPFEGKSFKAPVGYKEWLTAFYGDYMQLPPVEKRISHHQFEAYYVR